jgi:hypothetical protein
MLQVVWRSFTDLWLEASKLRSKNVDWDWLLAVLVPILDVPELASTNRVAAAVKCIDELRQLEAQAGVSGILGAFSAKQSAGSGFNVLSFACKTRRAEIVKRLTAGAPASMLNDSKGSLPPLLTACQVPPFGSSFELQMSYPSAKNTHKFKDWSFNWTLRISKPGENPQGHCMCCSRPAYRQPAPNQQKKTAEQLSERMGNLPFLSAHLDMREAQFLGSAKAKVTFRVEVVGLTKPQDFVVTFHASETATGFTGSVEGGPMHFKLADDSTKEYPLESSQNNTVTVRFTVTEIKAQKCMWRTFRTRSQILEEQAKIVKDLVVNGADRGFTSTAGYLAFSYALDHGMPKDICDAVLPTNVLAALNALLSRKDLNMRELEAYKVNFPQKANAADVTISGLVRKPDYKSKNVEASHSALVSMLDWLLKKGGASPLEFTKAVRSSVELRDWVMLETLLNYPPKSGVNLSGLLLHDVINKVNLLKKLLEAGANPNEVRTVAMAEGETAMHVAARAGNLEAVELLLEHKGDCNIKEKKSGNTALHEAAAAFAGQEAAKVVQLMTQSGADTNARNARRQTALQVCFVRRKCALVLQHHHISAVYGPWIVLTLRIHTGAHCSLQRLSMNLCAKSARVQSFHSSDAEHKKTIFRVHNVVCRKYCMQSDR